MYSFWTHLRKYLVLGQLALILGTTGAQSQDGLSTPNFIMKKDHISRAPASYIPDDDVIVKPMDNQLSFYQQYVESDQSIDVVNSRNQLKVWNDNQNFADHYGMDSTLAGSTFFVPTPEEKWEYFKSRYMRYLRQKGEQPLKDMPKNFYNDYRASNEVDTIDEMEARFKASNKNSTVTRSALPGAFQEKQVSLWKKTKFIFQPRVDQGLVIVGLKTPYGRARAWVGINGETEVNIQQTYDSIGLRVMYNYFAHTGRYFTSVDQRLMENVYARVTSNKDPQGEKSSVYQDDTFMLLYAKSF
jgi:hypothetical protein